jgi:hypothetical protein
MTILAAVLADEWLPLVALLPGVLGVLASSELPLAMQMSAAALIVA